MITKNVQIRKFFALYILGLCGILALSACVNVRTAEYNTPLEEPKDAQPAPIKFTNFKIHLPYGKDIGVFRKNCFLSYARVNGQFLQNAPKSLLNSSFTQTLESLGYDVVNSLNKDFDEEIEDELMRSEYKISAKIIDADIDACSNKSLNPLENKTLQYEGELYLKIEWAVYDNLRKTVVYKTITEGAVNQNTGNKNGLELMMTNAFSMAAYNLGTDKNFHDLIFFGTIAPKNWAEKKDMRPRAFSAQEKVTITNPLPSQILLNNHIETLQKTTVIVQAGAGHGSGVFITQQGHILTNQHVVGDAMRVRIVTANKKEKLIAEVLRTDSARDVALLKIENLPDDLKITTAPIQTIWPKVSSDIYALGAPSSTRLQDTLSKGIVSAHRKNFRIFNTNMDFIQGDIVIREGNSGGPLFDAYGNIIAISEAGLYHKSGEGDSGLNLFIPIEDALKHLNIDLN